MLLLLALLPTTFAAEVRVPWALYERLMPPRPELPEVAPGPMVVDRRVEVEEIDGSIRVDVRWTIRTERKRWLELPLPDPSFWAESVTWKGRPVAVRGMRDGSRRLLVEVDGTGELVLRGELPGELRRGIRLVLPEATTGQVVVKTADPEVEVTGGGVPAVPLHGALWTGARELTISTQKQIEDRVRPDVIVASSGVGVTVGDGSVRVKGRLLWRVQRGALKQVRFTVVGGGSDLEVKGAQLASWERSGQVVTAVLTGPEDTAVQLEITWTATLPDSDEAKLELPRLTPLDVFRVEHAVQIARDGDREIVPELGTWAAVAHKDLPEVADGLVEGTPVSSWTLAGSPPTASIGLYRFQPVAGPPTFIDVAAYEGALSEEGRLLLRAHYAVRNDRGAFLTVDLPSGTRLISARVDGEPARVGRDGSALLLPLAKSLETVQGLLSFPITLVMIQELPAFERLDERSLVLPRLGAEVAATRVSLRLPPQFENRIPVGERGTVAGFSEGEGLTYGFLVGDANVAQADQLYRAALDSWMTNAFDEAQQQLDDLRSLGGDNDNVRRLQSNIDVVLGGEDHGDVTMANRIKEEALARAGAEQESQVRLSKEAEQAYFEGKYDDAEKAYAAASAIGSKLELLQTGGSVEISSNTASFKDKLTKTRSAMDKKKQNAHVQAAPIEQEVVVVERNRIEIHDAEDGESEFDSGTATLVPGSPMNVEAKGLAAKRSQYPQRTEINFDDVEVTGELVKPQGQLIVDRLDSLKSSFSVAASIPNAPAAEPLAVIASNLDVVIPALGQTVRYQKLLTPAGERVALQLRSKRRRRR